MRPGTRARSLSVLALIPRLRCSEDWNPVMNLQTVIYGLMFLFLVRSGRAGGCAGLGAYLHDP